MNTPELSEVAVSIASCPEHGLHGARTTCLECDGPVDQVLMLPVRRVATAWRALERRCLWWVSHAIYVGAKVYELRDRVAALEDAIVPLAKALEQIEHGGATSSVGTPDHVTARRALREYRLRAQVAR